MTVMRPISIPTLTVFDLEFTAWECSMANHWLRPGEFKEVVQIGAVRLDATSFEMLDEFEILVRPRINATLSAYFENLTGITNAMLAARGGGFRARPMRRFADFAGTDPICAFGHDEWVLEDNIRLYGLKDHAAAAGISRSARLVRGTPCRSARPQQLRYRPDAGRAVCRPCP